jgi:HEAT repeat protein
MRSSVVPRKNIFFSAVFLCFTAAFAASCGKNLISEQQTRDSESFRKIRMLYESGDWAIRQRGISETGRLIRERGYSALPDNVIRDFLLRATEDAHPMIKIDAIETLKGLSADSSVSGRLMELSLKEADPNVRWTAIRILAESPPDQALPVFVDNFESDDWIIREASITGILRINNESLRDQVTPLVVRALQDRASGVRIAALNNLSFRDESFYRLIRRHFHEKPRPQVRILCAALKAIRGYDIDKDTREKIIALLSHPDKNVRLLALRTLKKQKK